MSLVSILTCWAFFGVLNFDFVRAGRSWSGAAEDCRVGELLWQLAKKREVRRAYMMVCAFIGIVV